MILEDNYCLCTLQVAQLDFIVYLETSGHTDVSDYTLGHKTKHKDKNVRKGFTREADCKQWKKARQG